MSRGRMCAGSNYKQDDSPDHETVRSAVSTIKAHLNSEWIVDGCKADHAFGCASCQALLLSKELDGVVAWLDDEEEK